jgi:hypothetical protein
MLVKKKKTNKSKVRTSKDRLDSALIKSKVKIVRVQ